MTFRHLTAPPQIDPRVAVVKRQLRHDFGVQAPPVWLHGAHVDLLCGVWCVLREVLVVGQVPRREKESIAEAISRTNQCSFCVDAHSIMGAATGQLDQRSFVPWATATGGESPSPIDDPTSELRGTAFAFHYINRMVTIFLGDSPLPFAGRRWRRAFETLSIAWFRRSVRRPKRSGEALTLLPAAPCPPQLDWATGHVRDALSRFSGAVEHAGREVLSEQVRSWVTEALMTWNGEPLSLDGPELPDDGDQTLATITWLSARAPERITDRLVADAREHGVDDRTLIAATAWGAHAAALRLAERWS